MTGRAAVPRQPRSSQARLSQARLGEAARIVAEAAGLLGGDVARAALWFRHHPLAGFGGATAEGLVAAGHAEAVLAYLRKLGDGVFA